MDTVNSRTALLATVILAEAGGFLDFPDILPCSEVQEPGKDQRTNGEKKRNHAPNEKKGVIHDRYSLPT